MIRIANPSDAQRILDVYAPSVLQNTISFEVTLPTVTEMRDRIERTLVDFPWIVDEITEEGQPVLRGFAYAGFYRVRQAYQWCAETSVYTHLDYRREGVGKALYEALFEILRKQGVHSVVASVTAPNPVSCAFHASMGFQQRGYFPGVGHKLGGWLDVSWWQLNLLPQTHETPHPTVKFSQLGHHE